MTGLRPESVSPDISLFNIDAEKYPLLKEVESYVETATLRPGDCLYIPSFYFSQVKSLDQYSTYIGFLYESESKLTEAFIKGIHHGVLLNG